MPEKVTIETDGFATSSCGQVSVVVDKRHRSQIEKRHNPAKDSQPRCPEGPCLK